MKPAEVAALLAVSRDTVYRLINSGELPSVQVGPRAALRVEASALAEYIESRRRTA